MITTPSHLLPGDDRAASLSLDPRQTTSRSWSRGHRPRVRLSARLHGTSIHPSAWTCGGRAWSRRWYGCRRPSSSSTRLASGSAVRPQPGVVLRRAWSITYWHRGRVARASVVTSGPADRRAAPGLPTSRHLGTCSLYPDHAVAGVPLGWWVTTWDCALGTRLTDARATPRPVVHRSAGPRPAQVSAYGHGRWAGPRCGSGLLGLCFPEAERGFDDRLGRSKPRWVPWRRRQGPPSQTSRHHHQTLGQARNIPQDSYKSAAEMSGWPQPV